MKNFINLCGLLILCLLSQAGQGQGAKNPIIHADVPDLSMIRVGDTYYMSSTTMHMNPGVPVMKSKDLVNWELVSYAYDILEEEDKLSLNRGLNDYGRGSWASSLRHHQGQFYLSTFSGTTGKTYIFKTKDPEKGPWERISFEPSLHDHSLFFDEDGKAYMIWGGGTLRIAELKEDLSGLKAGTERVLIENANAPAQADIMLPAEGSQLFKVGGKYYLFNIVWPRGGMRTVLVHRADKITGPWEGRLALQDKGVAQGGLIDTPEGKWFAYLFRDWGAVGRIPYLVPVQWQEGWPVLGIEGKVPDGLELPASRGLMPGIVASDEFSRKKGEPALPLVWQWNHNPDNGSWSLSERKGYLRLKTSRTDSALLQARNTLTQRTFGPQSAASTLLDISGMKAGDVAGLVLLQKKWGLVGVRVEKGKKWVVMQRGEDANTGAEHAIPMNGNKVYLKAEADFRERADTAYFYYSFDGKAWKPLGEPLKMEYTLPHFMGYRFGLFNYATLSPGGHADFDYFRLSDQISQKQ